MKFNLLKVNPLESELFTKQACRDASVVSLFFCHLDIYLHIHIFSINTTKEKGMKEIT